MKNLSVALILVLSMIPALGSAAKKQKTEEPETRLNAETLSGLELRNIGPAINSGRVVDFAVTPGKRHRFFAATASGGLWKTENAGTTWTPVFDDEGSYSIGCVTIDPNRPLTVWVGTGENNSQRSVSYGDGDAHGAAYRDHHTVAAYPGGARHAYADARSRADADFTGNEHPAAYPDPAAYADADDHRDPRAALCVEFAGAALRRGNDRGQVRPVECRGVRRAGRSAAQRRAADPLDKW